MNIYLDAREHAALAVLDGADLRKRRAHVQQQGQQFGVDIFEGALAGLLLCEVETATLEDLAALHAPSWAPIEVTEDPFFAGGALCRADARAVSEHASTLRLQGR